MFIKILEVILLEGKVFEKICLLVVDVEKIVCNMIGSDIMGFVLKDYMFFVDDGRIILLKIYMVYEMNINLFGVEDILNFLFIDIFLKGLKMFEYDIVGLNFSNKYIYGFIMNKFEGILKFINVDG